jgi:hypothetical protein
LGYALGDFFTHSSGHPDRDAGEANATKTETEKERERKEGVERAKRRLLTRLSRRAPDFMTEGGARYPRRGPLPQRASAHGITRPPDFFPSYGGFDDDHHHDHSIFVCRIRIEFLILNRIDSMFSLIIR